MATYKIITKRYLRKYTAAERLPVSASIVAAQTVVDKLCDIPWEEVAELTGGVTAHDDKELDANVTNRNSFDAALFCAEHGDDNMHRAYANAACYRIPLPSGAAGIALTGLKVRVTSDAYNAHGARLAIVTNSTGVIPTDCATCRGEDGIHAAGVAPQTIQTVSGRRYGYPTIADCVFAVSPAEGEYEIPTGGLDLGAYLYLFVAMENYNSVRGNWLEGSSAIRNLIEITTASPIPGWTDGATIDLTTSSGKSFPIVSGGVVPDIQGESSGMVYQSVTAAGSAIAVDDNFKVANIAPFKDEHSPANSRVGLSVLYANLDVGNLKAVPASVTFPDRRRHGVGFNVNQSLVDLVDVNGQATAVRTLTMTSSSLLVPFHAPKDSVNAIRFDWADWVQANAPSAETVFNFWIKGGIVNDYPEATLKNPSIYRADKNDVDGWKLLGSAPATSGTTTLPLQVTPDTASTVLVTCYIPQEAITHTTSDFDAGSARLVYNGTTPENHLAEDYPDVPMFDPTVGTYPAGSIFKIGCRIAKREGEYGITEYDIDSGIKICSEMESSATNANGETVATFNSNIYARKEGVDPAHAWHKVKIMDGETELAYTTFRAKIVPIGSHWYVALSISGVPDVDSGSGFADSYLGPFAFTEYDYQQSGSVNPYFLIDSAVHHVIGEVDICFKSGGSVGFEQPIKVYRSKDYGVTWEILFDAPWTIIGEVGGLFAFKVTETISDDTTVPVTYMTSDGIHLNRYYNFDATGALTYRDFFVLNRNGFTYLLRDFATDSYGRFLNSYAVGRKCDGDILLKVAGNYMVRACSWAPETSGGEPGDLHYEYTHDGFDWKVITPPEGVSFDVSVTSSQRFHVIGVGDEITATFSNAFSSSADRYKAFYVTNDFVNFREISVPQELYDIGYTNVFPGRGSGNEPFYRFQDGTTDLVFAFVNDNKKGVLAISFDEGKTLHLITGVRVSRGLADHGLAFDSYGITAVNHVYSVSRGYTTVKTQKDYPVYDAADNDVNVCIFKKLNSDFNPGRTIEILDPQEPMRLLGRDSLCIPDITLIG